MKKYLLAIIILSLFFADEAAAGLSFNKKITLITQDQEDILQQQKFYSEGDMIRIEEESSGIEGNPGIRIYDFKNKKLYTIMKDVQLYIVQDTGIEKEDLMFEIPPEKKYAGRKDLKVKRTRQGEETIAGHPSVRYEIKVIREGDKKKKEEEQVLESYILWVAKDLEEMPVRYEFELPHNSKRVISYTEIKSEEIDPSLFAIPEGYMPVSPF